MLDRRLDRSCRRGKEEYVRNLILSGLHIFTAEVAALVDVKKKSQLL
jgi:hypothetical protein